MGGWRALGAATLLGTLLYMVLGFPGWAAGVFSVLGFLGLGGWGVTKIAIKTGPRDLQTLTRLLLSLRDLRSWKDKTVADVFAATLARHPDKPAILFEDQQWTFRELDCFANQVAHFFLEQGLKKDDTVAMFMENCPEYIGLWLGLSKIGVKASFINYNLREAALLHCLLICNPKAIVYSASLGEAVKAVHSDIGDDLHNMMFAVRGAPSLHQARELDKVLKGVESGSPPPLKDSTIHDYLCYIYTSGTTGLPKAVPIRHQRYLHMANGIRRMMVIQPDDIIYCTLPLYHTNGGILGAGQLIIHGTTIALRRKFSASQFWNDCVKYKCTVIQYIGELCRYLLTQPRRPLDTQHCVRMAVGNGLRPQLWGQFQTRFNIPNIREFYGSTEGNVSIVNITGQQGACGFNSVLLPFVYPIALIKVDPETGEHVRDSNGFCVKAGFNEPGELVGKIADNALRRFDGYENKDATNKKVKRNVFKPGDSYFMSGDVLRMDEEGYLYFCDRTGDTFRWKGENVSTTEVEGVIGRILELREVVVYGVDVPGAEGKAGMACIVGDEESVDIEDLAEKVYRNLPAYAIPLFVRLIPKADLTGTFKFQKTRVRAEGYDIGKVTDPLFILDAGKKTYIPLNEDMYQQLQTGQIRL